MTMDHAYVIPQTTDLQNDLLSALQRTFYPGCPLSSDLPIVILPDLQPQADPDADVSIDPLIVDYLVSCIRQIAPTAPIRLVTRSRLGGTAAPVFSHLQNEGGWEHCQVELVDLNDTVHYDVFAPGLPMPLSLSELFIEPSYLISVTGVQTRPVQRLSAACDVPVWCIAAELQARYPEYFEPLAYAANRILWSDLCVVDARLGHHGTGPLAGRPLALRCLVVGDDPFSVDALCAQLLGMTPLEVPYLAYAFRQEGRKPPVLPAHLNRLVVTSSESTWSDRAAQWQYRVRRAMAALERAIWVTYRLRSYPKRRLLERVRTLWTS